jgi:hypothetical protein
VGGAGGKLELHWYNTLHHLDDLPFGWAGLMVLFNAPLARIFAVSVDSSPLSTRQRFALT